MENEREVRTDMAEAIHAGYTAEDPAAREGFRKMFDNEEPSIEAFIARITLQALSKQEKQQVPIVNIISGGQKRARSGARHALAGAICTVPEASESGLDSWSLYQKTPWV